MPNARADRAASARPPRWIAVGEEAASAPPRRCAQVPRGAKNRRYEDRNGARLVQTCGQDDSCSDEVAMLHCVSLYMYVKYTCNL